MINIKTRLKNGATLTGLISILALLGNQIAVLFGVDYSAQIEQLVNIAGTILLVLSSLGVITDPNTKGISDSTLAKTYDKPRDEVENPVDFVNEDDTIPVAPNENEDLPVAEQAESVEEDEVEEDTVLEIDKEDEPKG
ncbi:holin [Staphylococcus phage SpP]